MSPQYKITRSEAIEQVLADLEGPTAMDEIYERVLDVWPSKAKNPKAGIRQAMRYEHAGRDITFLDKQTIIPMRIAMQGVRFRISLPQRKRSRGVISVNPWFQYMVPSDTEVEGIRLLDAEGQPLRAELKVLRQKVRGAFGAAHAIEIPSFNLVHWFRKQQIRQGDSLLVTIENWEEALCRLEHEPTAARREAEIEPYDKAFADRLFAMLERAYDEAIFAHIAIPTTYARMAGARRYPGHHWSEIVGSDPRMKYDGIRIRYSESRSHLDIILGEEETINQVPFTSDEGQQVYRFKAALEHNTSLWRRIEIQGEQALFKLDRSLRTAFQHDTSDHLSGFWKLIRRGKGKRFREVDVGTLNPSGGGSGADITVAGLGLEVGQTLKYVYDFGDWIEHRLVLEAIGPPKANADYPRVTGRNKPRYRHCTECKAEGRERRATWICLTCANFEGREVLLCNACARDHDEAHYVEEILY